MKRHHLPFTTRRQQQQQQHGEQTSCGAGNRINQVFLVTCVASFVLQLIGSLASWQNSYSAALLVLSNNQDSLSSSTVTASSSSSANRHRRAQVIGQQEEQETLAVQQQKQHALNDDVLDPPQHSGRLRVLVGILTADFPNDESYRKRHRKLFQLWNDPRVCSLPDFKARPIETRYECQLIYTFVLGGNPNVSPELVDDSRPMEVTKPIKGRCTDLNEPDTTLLNIRENMNEGKSQTWLKHGADIAEEYGLDYIAKCDADTLLHLHDFFIWAYKHLPPAPYNKHVYVGALRDKAYWPRHETEEERIRFESYFGNTFEGVHLYVAGQIYIVSTDLARFIGKEALTNKCSYCEGHEDHDISAMAFHSPEPIKLMVIGRSHRFWEHPVKGEPRWRRIWAREQARMAGKPFEGKVFNKDSSFEAVMKSRRR